VVAVVVVVVIVLVVVVVVVVRLLNFVRPSSYTVQKILQYTGRFIMFSVITNIYAYAEPSTLLFSTSIAP
jgi:branched-subunit amino acid transport protein AzlD